MLSTPNPNLTWRRDLIGSKLVIWNNLTSRLATVALTHEDDEIWWNLDSTGVFSVKSHYWGLINQNVSNANKGLWKLKIPLNLILKYFFGTLNAVSFSQRIILRNETGKAINSVVCHENETIQHMFFDCRFTRLVWATIYAAWGLPRPRDVSSMFGNLMIGVPKEYKQLVRVGAAALCWSVWRCRNSVIFYNKQPSFLKVIYSTTHWLRTWTILHVRNMAPFRPLFVILVNL